VSQEQVAILMGSDSDLEIMNEAASALKEFGIGFEMHVMSAHRSPEAVAAFATQAQSRGFKVFIAGAGGAAHLAGVIAAHTVLPVLGVPINSSPLNGFDALLATVQMPAGIPVGTLAVGKAGARNAGLLAVQILATSNKELTEKFLAFKKKLADGVRQKDEQLQKALKS
jgi:phosphoribosylaminoimidazole carboxylase PurE protein